MPESEPFGTPQPYRVIVGRNISAARGRLRKTQTATARRMQALKFDKWRQQTVASVEAGTRPVTVEEVFGLAYSLETSIAALLSPTADDKRVQFPCGESVEADSVNRSVRRGINDGSVDWDGDTPARIGEPTYPPGVHPAFGAWPSGDH